MTLLEILIAKLERWPDRYPHAVQGSDGAVYLSVELPRWSDVADIWVTGCEYIHISNLVFQAASDYKTSVVNRSEWESSR
ncbi:hypothetical protein [Pragia fontium]|uniref:hypothetical protein n=1 Tax=Pragia fontium TaxID=82985 RepID=UPI000F70FA9F|nr:hypothetical protein [Pragia fontium]VEJ54579.1 Uncharacterised protein [Pragia fontium]